LFSLLSTIVVYFALYKV